MKNKSKFLQILLISVLILFFCNSSNAQSKIIGNSIKIGSLEVAQHDFPESLSWENAEKACAHLGSGWRLPSRSELNFLYQKQDQIGGFRRWFYWSSTQTDETAWMRDFGSWSNQFSGKWAENYVRAVRDRNF